MKNTYKKILESPREALNIMKEFSKDKTENYYSIIKELENKYDFNIITTNYTTFCENITGIEENKIAYVHGKFGWFENPRTLQVIDISEEKDIYDKGMSDGDVFFPYIFVQSGVKPIVDQKQIKEYSKMIDFFDMADIIFILGYRLNCDDNHINSVIRSAICKGKKVVYFIYENDLDDKTVIKRLRFDDTDEYNNLMFIYLHKENCFSEFRKQLQQV